MRASDTYSFSQVLPQARDFLFYLLLLLLRWIRSRLSRACRTKSRTCKRKSNFYVLLYRPPPHDRNPPFQTPKSLTDILRNLILGCHRLRQSYGLMLRLLAMQLQFYYVYLNLNSSVQAIVLPQLR